MKQLDYTGKVQLKEKMCMHGFYRSKDSLASHDYTLMFWDDGTFMEHIYMKNDIQQINSLLCSLKKDYDKTILKNYNYYRSWGFYKIQNDNTIKGFVIHPYGGMSLYLYDLEFKIINDSTIERIKYNYQPTIVSSVDLEKSKKLFDNDNRRLLSFKKTECIPVFNPWLKQKRWFWADKQAYKAYKKQVSKNNKDIK